MSVAGLTYPEPDQAFSIQFVPCYAKPYSGAWRKHGWILSDYCTLGANPSKVSSCKLFTSCLMTIIPCYHICFWSYHTEYVTMSFSLSLSLLQSIFTSVHSQPHDSILLTDIAEQIVNRFHSNLFACLSIISPRTVSYCICICLLSKFVLEAQVCLFFFLQGVCWKSWKTCWQRNSPLLVDEP